MRKIFATVAGLMLGAGLAAPAHATDPDIAVNADCLPGWYVNPDETDRKPTSTEAGLKFAGDDLVHHAVSGLSVADLKPGEFVASPAPDQPSFFSVEVNGEGSGKYGTLRWNTSTSKWNMVANGGTFYEDTDPVKVVTAAGKGTSVISFGVGYTKNPPGTVETTVVSVKFGGKTHSLKCQPEPEPTKTSASPSPSPSVSSSASSSPSASSSSNPAAGGVTEEEEPTLPITGMPIHLIVAVAAGLILVGGLALGIARLRRRNRFTA